MAKDMYDVEGSGIDARDLLENNDSLITVDEYILTIDGISYTFMEYDGRIKEGSILS